MTGYVATADSSVVTSTLTTDTELTINCVLPGWYSFEAFIPWKQSVDSGQGIQVSITGSVDEMSYAKACFIYKDVGGLQFTETTGISISYDVSGINTNIMLVTGSFKLGNAVDVLFRVSQKITDGNFIVRLRGSYLKLNMNI